MNANERRFPLGYRYASAHAGIRQDARDDVGLIVSGLPANAAAVFTGLLFWSWLWGVWGTILAVPMLMMLKAICDHVEDLQPIGELLGE